MTQTRGGVLLRRWLREERRSQEWVAGQIGTHQTNVSAWTRGRPIPLDKAIAIRDLTGIAVEAWAEEADDADESGEHSALPVAGTG